MIKIMTRFEAKDLITYDKVVSTWLANAPWRKKDDSSVQKGV